VADKTLSLSRTQWAEKIIARYQDSVAVILDVGRYLIQAKAQLVHGEFGLLVDNDLPFSWRTANRFMLIAENPVLTNSSHGSNLPTSWRTLAELAKLPEEVLEEALDAGRITPELKRKEVATLLPPPPRSKRKRSTIVVSLEDLIQAGQTFGTIYADPPWPYENQATRAATDNHYPTMSLEEMKSLLVKDLAADNAHLHLWTTDAFLFACPALMEAWGFAYAYSMLVWIKPQMGIGNRWRHAHEVLLLGVRGSAPFLDHRQLSWFEEERGEHSEKPETAREKIELVSPGPYLELFGRKHVSGWTVWGNEIV